jgi:hypothetical protein
MNPCNTLPAERVEVQDRSKKGTRNWICRTQVPRRGLVTHLLDQPGELDDPPGEAVGFCRRRDVLLALVVVRQERLVRNARDYFPERPTST